MFKEALIGIFILFLFYLVWRQLWKKNRRTAGAVLTVILLLSCFANVIYNHLVMFPDFYMDTVSGVFRYGTFKGNLLAYSDEFMFQDEIIFPVLRDRQVFLDTDAGFYEKFFSLYAGSCEPLSAVSEHRDAIISRAEDFDFSHEFSCMGIMDYVTDGLPQELTASFEKEIYPTLYINTASLQGQQQLAAVMDENYDLYIMSKAYYDNTTGGNNHE